MFPGIFGDIPRNITFPHSPRSPHSVARSCIPVFIHSLFNSAPFIVTVATTNVAITDLDLFNNTIFTAINKIRRNRQRAEINAIFKEIIKNDHYKDLEKDVLQQQINMVITEEKILNKINRIKNFYKVNENKVDIFMLDEVRFQISHTRFLLHNNQSMI